ncbi:hypothetical protein AB0N87_05750 [Streptomyces sp. NPDC093228]|uniref:hypothetical protein n=1 Tax=unclassified Streptomyces TaxID=2593676 RepID=UPI001F339E47|nr:MULTISPECIES: hypothetical protein [unclassified Streptomyces]MDX3261245.1 hypothetical protein [Streptomyces sp. MI02-2A]
MATGGVPRPGVTALGLALGLALLAGGSVTACDNSGSGGGRSPGRAGVSPSPRTTPAQELCARVVGYWSRKVLDSDTYGDYQTMGLSNGQYEILRSVVDAARAVKRRQGAEAADQLIDRRAHEGCADWYRTGGPSNGPWQ